MKLTKQLRIFLLYARSDQEAVGQLYKRLVKEGANVWFDQVKLLPGQDWQHEIRQAIQDSDLAIICLSKEFNKQGGYRHEELRMVAERASSLPEGEIFVIPARLEKCDLPEPIRRWQCVNLFEADGYKNLIGSIKRSTISPAYD